MDETTAARVVRLLKGQAHRHRTGVLLLPLPWLSREREIAARLGITYADERELVLQRLAPGQRYLGIGWEELITSYLDSHVRGVAPVGGCVLVANLDLLVCSLPSTDRDRFWSFVRASYRPSWGLLMALPEDTRRLMTDEERSLWAIAERLAVWEGGA